MASNPTTPIKASRTLQDSPPPKPKRRGTTNSLTSFVNNSKPDELKNWKEDLFGDGLPFYDFLVSLDSYLDLFKRQTLDPLKNEWDSRTKPITEEWKARAREAQLAIESKLNQTIIGSSSGISTSIDSPLIGPEDQNKQTRIRSERELREFAERELKEFREKLKIRRERIQSRWNDSKTVSLREKTSFFIGVQNVLCTALLLAFWPEHIPLSYTLQAAYYLPLRVYTYRQQAYHYFLFDICYVINGLCLIFLWIWPSNVLLFQACYGLAHGPSAIAIATWRNSLVFHSVEKVTSLFIHIYPALVFTVLRHYYPNAAERYPALKSIDRIPILQTIGICSTIHLIWQTCYYRFVIIARAKKISEEGRPTSFTYLLNSKTGLISKLLRKVKPQSRAHYFMIAQFFYTVITILPSLIWFYNDKTLSGLFLWLMFSVSVWNGASFYMEVFGRRFEREMIDLRKELDSLQKESNEIEESSISSSSYELIPNNNNNNDNNNNNNNNNSKLSLSSPSN